MIHLVTSAPALYDVIEWVAPDDILVIAGGALNAAHGLQRLLCRTATFTDDKALFPNLEIDTITTEEWLNLLEESPCRTWS